MVDMAMSTHVSVRLPWSYRNNISTLARVVFAEWLAGPLDSRKESNLTARLSCISKYLRLICNGLMDMSRLDL